MFGSTEPKIVSGVFTWIGIALVAVVVYWITRRRKTRLDSRTLPQRAVFSDAQ
jgi:LPXTG-motif cell wall-anchored protein